MVSLYCDIWVVIRDDPIFHARRSQFFSRLLGQYSLWYRDTGREHCSVFDWSIRAWLALPMYSNTKGRSDYVAVAKGTGGTGLIETTIVGRPRDTRKGSQPWSWPSDRTSLCTHRWAGLAFPWHWSYLTFKCYVSNQYLPYARRCRCNMQAF